MLYLNGIFICEIKNLRTTLETWGLKVIVYVKQASSLFNFSLCITYGKDEDVSKLRSSFYLIKNDSYIFIGSVW